MLSGPADPRGIVQYQARRLKRGRWLVVAAHDFPAFFMTDYTVLTMEPQNRSNATKVANTLNALNNLPLLILHR